MKVLEVAACCGSGSSSFPGLQINPPLSKAESAWPAAEDCPGPQETASLGCKKFSLSLGKYKLRKGLQAVCGEDSKEFMGLR